MEIYCCECKKDVEAELITGQRAYQHREDLWDMLFWQCPNCDNFVGTHKNSKKHAPMGHICGKELKKLKMDIHRILDPLWRSGRYSRKQIYLIVSSKIGWSYHTGRIKCIEEAEEIYKTIKKIKDLS